MMLHWAMLGQPDEKNIIGLPLCSTDDGLALVTAQSAGRLRPDLLQFGDVLGADVLKAASDASACCRGLEPPTCWGQPPVSRFPRWQGRRDAASKQHRGEARRRQECSPEGHCVFPLLLLEASARYAGHASGARRRPARPRSDFCKRQLGSRCVSGSKAVQRVKCGGWREKQEEPNFTPPLRKAWQ